MPRQLYARSACATCFEVFIELLTGPRKQILKSHLISVSYSYGVPVSETINESTQILSVILIDGSARHLTHHGHRHDYNDEIHDDVRQCKRPLKWYYREALGA